MTDNEDTHLDQNIKRIDVGALVTLTNVSTEEREHFYISVDGKIQPNLNAHASVKVVTVDSSMAQKLIGKMKGDKLFHEHDLIIEFIEWPTL